jgi:RNA polymerase sigma factor (sigma-70 family)
LAAEPSIGRAARVGGPRAPEADLTRALYEQYGNQIFRYCLHQLGSREEAEDAVQSTFLNAFRGIKRGIVPELESAWLFKIAHNVCLSRRRSTWRRDRIESPTDFELVEELTPAPSRRADELMGLQDVLEQMPENQRCAILLREWQGLSYHEIADELGVSQAAVETLIFRARRALAQGLEEPPAPKKRGLVRGADWGNVLAGLKSLLLGGGAAVKVAATVAVVSATTVVATAPVVEHYSRPHAKPAAAASVSTGARSGTNAATGLAATNRAGGAPAPVRRRASLAGATPPAAVTGGVVSPAGATVSDTAAAATPPPVESPAQAPAAVLAAVAAPAPVLAPLSAPPAGDNAASPAAVLPPTLTTTTLDSPAPAAASAPAAAASQPVSGSDVGQGDASGAVATPVEVKKDGSSGTPTVVAPPTTQPTGSASGGSSDAPSGTPAPQQTPVLAPVTPITTTLSAPPAGDNAASPSLVLPPTLAKTLDSPPATSPASSTPAGSTSSTSAGTPAAGTPPATQSVPPSVLPAGAPPKLAVQPPASTTGHGTGTLSGSSSGSNP